MSREDVLTAVPDYPSADLYTIDAVSVLDALKDAAIDTGIIVQKWMFAPIIRIPYLDDPSAGFWYIRLGHIMLLAFLIALIGYLNRVWGI